MSIEEIIENLAEEYGTRPQTLRNYYEILKEYPMFNDEDAMECLSIICAERIRTVVRTDDKFISDVTGLPVQKFKARTKSIKEIINDALLEVYPEYYDAEERFSISSVMYDETEYDVMEREDQLENMVSQYYDEADDIRMKAIAAYEKTKKKNSTRK